MKRIKFTLLFLIFIYTDLFAQTEVKIGNQIWMTKNLDVQYFQNGDPIPLAKTAREWSEANDNKKPAFCYVDNIFENGSKYGLQYNIYAVIDNRGLTPKGWHIPSENEWKELINKTGGEDSCSRKLNSKSGWNDIEAMGECNNCKNWSNEKKLGETCKICNDIRNVNIKINCNGNNISGFNAMPSGIRNFGSNTGEFELGMWWAKPYYKEINFGDTALFANVFIIRDNKSQITVDGNCPFLSSCSENGITVRCIKD